MSDENLRFYIDDYSDEVVPCDCTLAGWAQWLSKPDPQWQRDRAANNGETFKASVLRFAADVVATKQEDGSYAFSHEPGDDAALIAVRFGPGLGWDPDNIFSDFAQLRDAMNDEGEMGDFYGADCFDDVEHIAVGFNEPDVVLTFHVGPPPRCSVTTCQ